MTKMLLLLFFVLFLLIFNNFQLLMNKEFYKQKKKTPIYASSSTRVRFIFLILSIEFIFRFSLIPCWLVELLLSGNNH